MKSIMGTILIYTGSLLIALFSVFLLVAFANPGNNILSIQMFFCGVVVLLGGFLIYFGIRLKESPYLDASSKIVGIFGAFHPNVTEERNLENELFSVLYTPPKKEGKETTPSSLLIKIPSICFTSMIFSLENWADRLGKKLGIACEVQTGDQKFDEEVYIFEGNPGYCSRFLNDAEVRGAIQALLFSGYQNVVISQDAIEATWTGFDPLKDDSENLIEHSARALILLRKKLPLPDNEEAKINDFSKNAVAFGFWILLIGWALTFIAIFFYKAVFPSELYKLAITTFVLIYTCFAIFTALLVKGKSTSHIEWFLLVNLVCIPLGFGSFGTMAGANALLDRNPPEKRVLTVVGSRLSESRKNKTKTYYAQVNSFKYPGELIEFEVDATQYHQIKPNISKFHLVSGKGFFNMEWEISREFEP